MHETFAAYCARMELHTLILQWDAPRNAPLTPDTVSYGSNRKVWWQCPQGHVWQASVYSRASGAGCPVCAGKIPVVGKTDLATRFPSLAAQWHPARNGALSPCDVLPGSHRMVWWQCESGHVWRAAVKSRAIAGSGCPVCAGKQLEAGTNDLQSRFPRIAAQWHPTRNGALSPRDVHPGSHRKVWWLCEKGHAWQAQVSSRAISGHGCPVCAGKTVLSGENDLQSTFPRIAAQWHPTKNDTLTPRDVTPSSNRKVWWQCELGHAYQAMIAARTIRGSGCPYCAGRKVLPGFNDLATLYPAVAAQWHPTRNGALTPQMVTPSAHKKVWWQCREGHVWQAVVYSRTGAQQCGCPVCAGRVRPEKRLRYAAMTAWKGGGI